MMLLPRKLFTGACVALAACDGSTSVNPPPPPMVRMEFATADFYAQPFPSDTRLNPDGTVNLAAYPRPATPNLVTSVVDLVDGRRSGFSSTSPIFFSFTESMAHTPNLPSFQASLDAYSPVQLIDADPASPRFGERVPISATILDDPGP